MGNSASLGEQFIYSFKKIKEKYEIHYTADLFCTSLEKKIFFASLLSGPMGTGFVKSCKLPKCTQFVS